MKVTATGWWLSDAEANLRDARRSALVGDSFADVAVIGAGYTGMWTAWHVLALAPGARVVLLERNRSGYGASGRNGGFCESYWRAGPLLRAAFDDEPARRLAEASSESVEAIGRWCDRNDVDAWFDRSGSLLVASSPQQNGRIDAIVEAADALGSPGRAVRLSAGEVQSRCASPTFGRAVFVPDFATVHPARPRRSCGGRVFARGGD
jgi:glycine/D-amino acid oxidase-like deaminating enzyme